MRTNLQKTLLLVIILTVLLVIAAVFLPYDALRLGLGLPVVLFFPGYTLLAALFPRQDTVDGVERIALSFGISVVVAAATLFLLNYSPWGIRLYPIILGLSLFIVVTALVAWRRQQRLVSPLESAVVAPRGHKGPWIVLTAVMLGAIAVLGYFIAVPKAGDSFTELYVLGQEGDAQYYPLDLAVGETGEVIVGFVNQEHRPVTYALSVVIDGVKTYEMAPLSLEHDAKWEGAVFFTPSGSGDRQKVAFQLCRADRDGVYREVHLWIDVAEPG